VKRQAQSGPAPGPRIGSLALDSPFVLAPMAGYTYPPFRALCRRFGCGLVYTELVSVEGIARRMPPSMHLLEVDPGEHPVAAHLYGHDPARFAEAARIVTDLGRFDAIDINAGCPVPKVVRRGDGAALMKDPARLGAIVAAVRAATSLPVTVKTRIGPSPERPNASEVARAVEEGGADAIAIHGRYTSRRHSGPADWDAILRVKAERRIPVIGNGGVGNPRRAVERLASGVDAVMIGRAAIGRPWFFRQAVALWRGEEAPEPAPAERRRLLAEHLEGLVELTRREASYRRRRRWDPEEAAARHFRGAMIRYLAGLPGLTEMKRRLHDVRAPADVLREADALLGGAAAPGGSSA